MDFLNRVFDNRRASVMNKNPKSNGIPIFQSGGPFHQLWTNPNKKCFNIRPYPAPFSPQTITTFSTWNKITPKRKNKLYADLLVDRPYNIDGKEQGTNFLLNCLRYRLRLSLNSDDGQINDSNNADYQDALEEMLCSENSTVTEVSITEKKKNSIKKSQFDTLLELINEFDAAGIVEICRLLLERRSAIPLFVPITKKHHLALLNHVTLPGNNSIRLGEDKTLMRIAVVSCRQRDESQTCQILQNIFHINSIHVNDLKNGCITSNELAAEIGIGFVPTDGTNPKVQNVLVVHVVGDFKPLWPFLSKFADCLLIEDGTTENDSFDSSFLVTENNEEMPSDLTASNQVLASIPLICIWKPSLGVTKRYSRNANEYGFRHSYIVGQLGGETDEAIKSTIIFVMKKLFKPKSLTRLDLYDIPILRKEEYSVLICRPSPTKVEQSLSNITPPLGQIRTNEFLLQKNFREQAKHEELKNVHRLEEEKVNEQETAIRNCFLKRRNDSIQVREHPLLKLLLTFLARKDPSTRVLSIQMLEKSLSERSERELASQLIEIRTKYAYYVQQSTRGEKAEKLESAKEDLEIARTKVTERVLNIEHLWRELGHLYTAMAPEYRSQTYYIPRLAAQHLLDGFCLELLDGDSNLIHMEWVKQVLYELRILIKYLGHERIFVLSVMGVQSSGKSTLLNTMFGIKMRTSVGQCTRGVNMQLLAVEGRPEYNYILLLDTEGTRSPDFHGLPGSEKRDNQMATLSILLADATIVVIPGENDAAIKEILPVVMMAYQGSKLAEANGGRLSSMIFFAYNQIDVTQKDKLTNIIQTLGSSLNEAFTLVKSMAGNEAERQTDTMSLRDFKLDTSNSSESDVCVLGNAKNSPNDTPNAEFGETLAKFREYIHKRVTSSKDGEPDWRGRSIDEFSQYVEDVWKCICSANFNLNFESVIERITFDKMDQDYKKVEQKLAECYRKSFENLKKKMVEEKGTIIGGNIPATGIDENRLMHFESLLRDEILPTERILEDEIKVVLEAKGRDKWQEQFQNLWRLCKTDQSRNWSLSLKICFTTIFYYEHHVENYKKKMRKQIGDFFKANNTMEWTVDQKLNQFNEIYSNILEEASKQFPPINVSAKIEKVYQKSNTIKSRPIKVRVHQDVQDFVVTDLANETIEQGNKYRSKSSHSKFYRILSNIGKTLNKVITKESGEKITACYQTVYRRVNSVVASKLSYDDNVISTVICDIDEAITSHNITNYSDIEMIHIYGRSLITEMMKNIQSGWEDENSVFAKLKQKSSEEAMRDYFILSAQGVKATQLFTSTIANALKGAILPVFEEEMIQKTSNAIRNERWLHDARFFHKYLDLHLVNLLEKNQVTQVLDLIEDPKSLYKHVLHQLIDLKVPDVEEEWKRFLKYLEKAIRAAALASSGVVSGRAQTFVHELRKEFLKNGLQNESLGTAFLLDVQGEFDDCDKEEEKEFLDECVNKLIQVLDQHKHLSKIQELSPKVVTYMISLNDSAALPRCDAYCPLCKSLCIEPANHDTKLRPHETIHQPQGILGWYYETSEELVCLSCNESYKKDHKFRHNTNESWKKFRDFAKVYPDWRDPRINEELPLREYVMATFNKEIAIKYNRKPSSNIPANYFHD